METHHMRQQKRKHPLFFLCSLLLLPCSLLLAVDDGYVVNVDSETIYLDWGNAAGVKKGDTFQTYIPGPDLKHPVSGQVLGQTKKVTGSGFVTEIQEKFSLGRITGREGQGPKTGQRTFLQAQAAVAPTPTPATASDSSTSGIGIRELWRSTGIPGEATGMVMGDLDGDGKKEMVISFMDRLEIFRWDGQKLVSVAVYKNRSDRGWLSVETADPQGTGKDLVFAGCVPPYAGARGKTIVYAFQDGTLKEVARGDGFVRKIDRWNAKPTLAWQALSMSRQVRVLPPSEVVIDGKKLKGGHPLPLPRALNDDQLLGLVYGDWDNDSQEDLALLQGGERLRIFFKGANWSAPEIYGGTKALIPLEEDAVAWVFPRMMNRSVAGAPSQLLVPRNVPKLGIRTTFMKFYDRSEIVALAWNGLEMAPAWRIPMQAYVADFAVGDFMGSGKSQLWTITHAPGKKALVLAFDIP